VQAAHCLIEEKTVVPLAVTHASWRQQGAMKALLPAESSQAWFLPTRFTFLVMLFKNESKTKRKFVLPETGKSVRAQQNHPAFSNSLNKLIFGVCYQNILWCQGQSTLWLQFISTQPSLNVNIRGIQSMA